MYQGFIIAKDKWDSFIAQYTHYGYTREGGFAYPDYVYKIIDGDKRIKINISPPCINIWDGEDKNRRGEIWLWEHRIGHIVGDAERDYVLDLINAGFVSKQ